MNMLAFSTLGCPAWNLDQILDAATVSGYSAVELRGYQEHMDLPLAAPFTRANRSATLRRFVDAGVEVCCVSSSGIVEKANLDHVRAHAGLAHALLCPYVRVFGGKLPDDVSHADGIARFAETLRAFGDAAQDAGVAIVLETHDSFSKGAEVAELLDAAAHPAVFSLWDLHHPFREGESPEESYRYLAPTLRHIHVKDGIAGEYTLLGDGDVPLFPMLDLALGGGYDGPISLEWEKRWIPALPDPEVAFPQYALGLKAYLAGRASLAP